MFGKSKSNLKLLLEQALIDNVNHYNKIMSLNNEIEVLKNEVKYYKGREDILIEKERNLLKRELALSETIQQVKDDCMKKIITIYETQQDKGFKYIDNIQNIFGNSLKEFFGKALPNYGKPSPRIESKEEK